LKIKNTYKLMHKYGSTYAISAYHHWCCGFDSLSGRNVQHYVIKFVSALWQVGGVLRLIKTKVNYPSSILDFGLFLFISLFDGDERHFQQYFSYIMAVLKDTMRCQIIWSTTHHDQSSLYESYQTNDPRIHHQTNKQKYPLDIVNSCI
jgi:hypothetical protein